MTTSLLSTTEMRTRPRLLFPSQQAVSRIESGEYEGMTLKALEKIGRATGTLPAMCS
ncbi:MAG: hypothetical protein AABY54_10555 [Deltaproteobacteria bacterium]